MTQLNLIRVDLMNNSDHHSYEFRLTNGSKEIKVTRLNSNVTKFLESFPNYSSSEDLLAFPAEKVQSIFTELLASDDCQLTTLAFLDDVQNQNPIAALHCQQVVTKMDKLQSIMKSFDSRLSGLEHQLSESVSLLEKLLDKAKGQSGSSSPVASNNSEVWKVVEEKPVLNFLCDASMHSSDASVCSLTSDLSGSVGDDHEESFAGFLVSNPQQLVYQSLCEDLMTMESCCLRYQEQIRSILVDIQPYEGRIKKYQSAIGFIRKQARLSINCSIVETGLHELCCNLPDDRVQISVLLSKTHFPTWHTSLCESLAAFMDRADVVEAEASNSAAQHSLNSLSAGDVTVSLNAPPALALPPPTPSLKVEDIKAIKTETGFKVFFTVNGMIVEVSANRRPDLCFIAFLDEVAALVGRDGLFKKSLALIRAWWQYSTAFLAGREISHYLPYNVLCLMICMVFNLHHAQIQSPLQALCFFLAEFSTFDGTHQVITLQGIVLHTSHRGAVTLLPPAPYHLIGHDTLEKYWQLYNLGVPEQPVFSSQMAHDPNARLAYNPYASRTVVGFEKKGFNVLNPFTHHCMLSKKVSSRRVNSILDAIRTAAASLKQVLSSGIVTGTDLQLVFGDIRERLQGFPKDPEPILYERDLLDSRAMNYSPSDRMWQNILYANFILESVVSESAILTATIESLAIKGPLPVGEVGKILTEMSGMQQLSLHLKEKFGGLKKFLEKFPEIFVFSNDHPFNPHVLLRSCLGLEYQKMIYRGVIPMQIMVLFKKTPGGKKAKALAGMAAGIAPGMAGMGSMGGLPHMAAIPTMSVPTGSDPAAAFAGLNLDKVQPFVPSVAKPWETSPSTGGDAFMRQPNKFPAPVTAGPAGGGRYFSGQQPAQAYGAPRGGAYGPPAGGVGGYTQQSYNSGGGGNNEGYSGYGSFGQQQQQPFDSRFPQGRGSGGTGNGGAYGRQPVQAMGRATTRPASYRTPLPANDYYFEPPSSSPQSGHNGSHGGLAGLGGPFAARDPSADHYNY